MNHFSLFKLIKLVYLFVLTFYIYTPYYIYKRISSELFEPMIFSFLKYWLLKQLNHPPKMGKNKVYSNNLD